LDAADIVPPLRGHGSEIGTLSAESGGQAQNVKEDTVGGFRVLTVITLIAGVILYLYYPERLVLIVLGAIVVLTLLFFLTLRPVPEPDRAIVYRLAKFHHIDGPGYVFLVPTFDKIEGALDMGMQEALKFDVPQIRTADNKPIKTNLEVSWRIHPDVNGRVNAKVKSMILMTPDQRAALVEEVVISMGRQVVSSYNEAQLSTAAAREAAAATMLDGANEILEGYGLQVDRVFWRGTTPPKPVSEAKVQTLVAQEQAESLIKTVEAIRTRLPDMQPEEFLALQAWLDMFRRGGGGSPPVPPG
jgi:regulator of protease activity HflC (stomatin/prohibitin superfamily)